MGHGMCMACACSRHVHGMGKAWAWHVYGMCTACVRHVYGMCTGQAPRSVLQVPTIQIFDGSGIDRVANLDCQPAQFKQARARHVARHTRGTARGSQHAWHAWRAHLSTCLPAYLLGGADDCGDDRREDTAAGPSRCREYGRRDGARSRPVRAWPRQE